eukprot:TRINITY_DN11638_c0_g1_i1.p1 TRINITY_DN11638_c0_g1~~TRINITY_DN11638_c0_g1_i1.p1  ORF type:complete len:183 (+),score=45.75 TRINITY_DN11638_c0_g1_i1:131-679(+)
MGVLFSSIWARFVSTKEYKVIIVGLDNAGKTTTLYKLLLDEVVVTAPTIGSNVEEVVYKNIRFLMWDIAGQEAARSTWSAYYQSTQAIILVVDSTDRDRIPVLKAELDEMLGHEHLNSAIVLVYANKQDVKGAMTAAEVSEALALHNIKKQDWHIQACCALTGEGLTQGMDWLSQHVDHQQQ